MNPDRIPIRNAVLACLSAEEVEQLIHVFAARRGIEGFTEAEALTLLDWAHRVRWAARTLDQLLEGLLQFEVTEGQLLFFVAPR